MLAAFLYVVAVSASPGPDPKGAVIGVLDQNYGEDNGRKTNSSAHKTYIAASYVKYLEAAGARVVPLHYQDSLVSLTESFGKINGLLYPGGAMELENFDDKYMQAVGHLWGLAIKANQAGDYFPVWGTCLGFETISVLAANDPSVLSNGFDSEDLALALDMTTAAKTSRLLGGAPSNILEYMTTTNSTMNNHMSGVTPATFSSNSQLAAFFDVLTTNTDRGGKVFGSTIEAKAMPIWGTQWHPEKTIFEWTNREGIPHTLAAISISQYTANFFVNEARKNGHVFPYDELTDRIIYNYNPEFTFAQGSNFEQSYIWSSDTV